MRCRTGMSKEGVTRISVSIPPELLRKFDEASERLGYKDRSKAAQAAMQSFVTESKWVCAKQGRGVGVIVLLYKHGEKDVEDALTDIQHRYMHVTDSSMHIHLDEENCLEIVPVKGSSAEIKDLAQELLTKEGVKGLKLAMVTP